MFYNIIQSSGIRKWNREKCLSKIIQYYEWTCVSLETENRKVTGENFSRNLAPIETCSNLKPTSKLRILTKWFDILQTDQFISLHCEAWLVKKWITGKSLHANSLFTCKPRIPTTKKQRKTRIKRQVKQPDIKKMRQQRPIIFFLCFVICYLECARKRERCVFDWNEQKSKAKI